MTWTAISTISELIGAIVVVVTLFYVAVQIRQNTNATLAGTRQGLLDADLALISEFMAYAIDPHLIGDDIELTPDARADFQERSPSSSNILESCASTGAPDVPHMN